MCGRDFHISLSVASVGVTYRVNTDSIDHDCPCVSEKFISRMRSGIYQAYRAMMSQYPFAALAGKVVDRKGPATCSLIGAFLSSTSFSAFAFETANPTQPTSALFHRLTLFYLVAGVGTVFS